MKIYNNLSPRINFGYDKQLNKELKSELKKYKEDKLWAETLWNMNEQCNNLETILIKKEKAHEDDKPIFKDIVEMFVDLKQTFAEQVELTFENLNYAARESRHYDKEHEANKDKKNQWRLDARNVIAWMTDDPPEAFLETEKRAKEALMEAEKAAKEASTLAETELDDEDDDELDLDSAQPMVKESKVAVKKPDRFIQKYEPTARSPKGFSDVAGMDKLKEKFQDGIIKAITNPEEAQLDYEQYGKNVPRGILLYGPPGCGKTFITKALAQEAQTPLYMLNLGNVGSGYVNLTSKNIHEAFNEVIAHAKEEGKPCLLFMDEIDTMAFNRNENTFSEDIKQVGTLLQVMDKAEEANVFIIGATNKYKLLDPAIRRRFDDKIAVDIPDMDTRKVLLTNFLSKIEKGQELASNEDEIEEIAKKLDGYSNDSICKIAKSAGNNALKRGRDNIKKEDFIKAIDDSTEEKPKRSEFLDVTDIKKAKIGFNQ